MITDEAVEAAARKIHGFAYADLVIGASNWDTAREKYRVAYRKIAREVLEVAAPLIVARALEGIAWIELDGGPHCIDGSCCDREPS